VSAGYRGVTNGEHLVVHEGDGHVDPLSAHRMDHFTNEVVYLIPVSTMTRGLEKAGVVLDPVFDWAEGNKRQALKSTVIGGLFVSCTSGSYL
jgi:hypothetical protein